MRVIVILMLLLGGCHARATTNEFDAANPLDRSGLAHRETPATPARDAAR